MVRLAQISNVAWISWVIYFFIDNNVVIPEGDELILLACIFIVPILNLIALSSHLNSFFLKFKTLRSLYEIFVMSIEKKRIKLSAELENLKK